MNNNAAIATCLGSSLLLLSSHVNAFSQLDELMVEGDLAVFKTHAAKLHAEPNCVNADKKGYWAVDLSSHSGRAAYSSLVTAMSTKAHVEVIPQNACLGTSGYEEVKSVKIKASNASGGGKSVRFVGFAKRSTGKHPFELDKICKTTPHTMGSRSLRWEDYLELKDEIDTALENVSSNYIQQTAWVSYAVQSASSQYDPQTKFYRHDVMLKDGSFVYPAVFSQPSRYPLNRYLGCGTHDGYGTVIYNGGEDLSMKKCSAAENLFQVVCVI